MTQANILICEDEKIIAKDIYLTLKKKGHNITSILDKGEESLNSIRSQKPDLVIMDIGLAGDWDGIKTAKIIKRNFDIPSIFISSHLDDTILEKAQKAKPYAFISKPVRDIELYSAIEFGLQRHSLEKVLKKRLAKKPLSIVNDITNSLNNCIDTQNTVNNISKMQLENDIRNYLSNDFKASLTSMISHIEELSQDQTLNQLQKHKIFASLFKYQKIINHLEGLLVKYAN